MSAEPVGSTDSSVVEASSAINASGDLFVFTRFDATGRSQLFYSELANGAWSTPVAAPINSTEL